MTAGVLIIEECQPRPVFAVRDFGWLLIAAVAENFGYRQLIQYYRLRGVVHFLRKKTAWAAVPRLGLGAPPGASPRMGNRRKVDRSIEARQPAPPASCPPAS